jgi:hypothetical protein
MIDSISGANSMLIARPEQNEKLSVDQRTVVASTLANYNVKNLSVNDKIKIREAFRAEGIRPSADLKAAVESIDFDAREIRGNEESGERPPPPPKVSNHESSLNSILEILANYEDEILSSDDLSEIRTKWLEAGGNQNSMNYVSLEV